MTKLVVALGSLTVGLVIGSLFAGIHTSIEVQPVFAQVSAIDVGYKPPEVFPLTLAQKGTELTGLNQRLDGLDCEGCVFTNVSFMYGGGAYQLKNCKFLGTTKMVFDGAAQNTLSAIALINTVEEASRPAPPPKKTDPWLPWAQPHKQTIENTQASNVSWISLAGLHQ